PTSSTTFRIAAPAEAFCPNRTTTATSFATFWPRRTRIRRKCWSSWSIPIAQYLNQFGRVELNHGDRPPADRSQRESVLLKPRVVAAPIDVEARIEEALERGRQEGLAAARAETAAALAQQRGLSAERESAARLAWQANEYAQFAEKIDFALGAIEERLAQGVARILKPFLIEEQVKKVTRTLSENLSRILSKDAPPVLKI